MRRLVAFVVLAYALSWAWWVPMVLTGTVVEPGQGWPTHLPGLLGPAIAAVIVTAATERGPGLRGLWSRVSRWRVPIRWYVLVIATLLLAAIPFALGTDLGIGDALAYSGAPAIGVSVVVYVVLVNGFGEEIGWRGYLADGLMHRHSEIVTALVVWLVWAGWHLPLFWIVDSFRDFGVAGSIGWFVGLGFGSVVLTWMYRSAQRSILIVALWHSAFNLATATRASAGVAAAVASTAVMIGGVVVAIRRHARDRPAISS